MDSYLECSISNSASFLEGIPRKHWIVGSVSPAPFGSLSLYRLFLPIYFIRFAHTRWNLWLLQT